MAMGVIRRVFIALGAVLLVMTLVAGTTYYRATRVFEVPVTPSSGDGAAGTLCKIEQVGDFSSLAFRFLLWWADPPETVVVDTGAKLYRLTYWTTRFDGAPTQASGLVAIPKISTFRGIVSYQHGTNVNRHQAPSRPTLEEGVLGAALFAGGGYLFAAADYVGLGASGEVHPYLIAENTANAVADLLRASKRMTEILQLTWPKAVYLTGFSQGGHATLASQRLLEKTDAPDLHVVASAPVSGVYDLLNISFPVALEGGSPAHAFYLAYLVNSYCAVYRQPPESLLAPPYAQGVPSLFDGEHDGDQIGNQLPASPPQLFTTQFLSDYHERKQNWFLQALAENSVLQWSPRAPLRLYVGEEDKDVSPKEAQAAAAAFSSRGCDVTIVSVGRCDHNTSIFRAIPKIRSWFDELSSRPSAQ